MEQSEIAKNKAQAIRTKLIELQIRCECESVNIFINVLPSIWEIFQKSFTEVINIEKFNIIGDPVYNLNIIEQIEEYSKTALIKCFENNLKISGNNVKYLVLYKPFITMLKSRALITLS